jgi:hypothetical protein
MRAIRYGILLPTRHPDGRWVSDAKLHQTRDELVALVGEMRSLPRVVFMGHAKAGPRFEEKLVQVALDVEDSPKNLQFFVRYKQLLCERFEQPDIYIACYPVDIL